MDLPFTFPVTIRRQVLGFLPRLDNFLFLEFVLFMARPLQARLEAALELVSQLSSIHRDRGASHIRRVCRTHKSDHVSDLLWCCQTLEGYCRDERRLILICVGEACEHAR